MASHIMLSYPKSGRTWLRFLLNHYLCSVGDHAVRNVFEIEKKDPAYPFEWTHLTGAMIFQLPYWNMGQFDVRGLDRRRAVLLVRDPYATLASAYHQAVHRIKVFNGTPAAFVRSNRYGASKLATFFNLWNDVKNRCDAHITVQYEDMLENPEPSIRRVLEFLSIPAHDEPLKLAVRDASFDNMKTLSTSPEYAGTPLAPVDPNNPDSAKVRSGTKQSYADLFTKDDLDHIDQTFERLNATVPATLDTVHSA